MTQTKVFKKTIKGKRFVFEVTKEYGSGISASNYNVVIYEEGKGSAIKPSAVYLIGAPKIEDAFLSALDEFVHDKKNLK